ITMKLIYCCLLAIAIHGYLADAQGKPQPFFPINPQIPTIIQKPGDTGKPQTPERPPRPQFTSFPQKPDQPTMPQIPQRPGGPQFPSFPQKPDQPTMPQIPQRPGGPQTPQKPGGPQIPQKPGGPQKPSNPITPTDSFLSCEVPQAHKIQCGPPGTNANECQAINCCYDGSMCYYGKYVTLQCTKDGQFIIVVARDATLPNIDLESISFLGSGANCGPVGTTSAFAVYQFGVTQCGTVMTEEPGVIVYENRMSSSYEVAVGPFGAITRDSQYDLMVQCRYIGTTIEALVVEVGVLPPPPGVAAPGPLRVELLLGNGECNVKGCIEEEVAFTSYFRDADYPVQKVLRDPVYVEVRILERTDPNIVLTLGRCWATTSNNPQSFPQWDLLIDGCPYVDDRYRTRLLPVDSSSGLMFPTHYRRFVFKMFTFVGMAQSNPSKKVPSDPSMTPLQEQVYIHCNAAVCQPSNTNSCEPRCSRKKREIGGSTKKLSREEATVVSSKELVFTVTE
uniref:Zona pellucida sperm-binding protein 4 n=2 Tax=Cyprinodon variegatus TaxID=28743 RepID=A0A3Q2CVQ4_CYPVA